MSARPSAPCCALLRLWDCRRTCRSMCCRTRTRKAPDVSPARPAPPGNAAASTTPAHLEVLDTLRAWSILWLVCFHVYYLSDTISGMGAPYPGNDDWVDSGGRYGFYLMGHLSVDGFLLISGFLIARIIVREQWKRRRRLRLGRFFFRRLLRVGPGLWCVMVIHYIIFAVVLGKGDDPSCIKMGGLSRVLTAVFLSNVLAPADMCMIYTWSVSLEVQFYVLIALLLWTLCYRPRMQKAACWAGILATLIGRAAIVWARGFRFPPSATDLGVWSEVYMQPIGRFGSIFCGALCALHYCEDFEFVGPAPHGSDSQRQHHHTYEMVATLDKAEDRDDAAESSRPVAFDAIGGTDSEVEAPGPALPNNMRTGGRISPAVARLCSRRRVAVVFSTAIVAFWSCINPALVFDVPCRLPTTGGAAYGDRGVDNAAGVPDNDAAAPPLLRYSRLCPRQYSAPVNAFLFAGFRLFYSGSLAVWLYCWLATRAEEGDAVATSSRPHDEKSCGVAALYCALLRRGLWCATKWFIEHPIWYVIAQVSYGMYLLNTYAVIVAGAFIVPAYERGGEDGRDNMPAYVALMSVVACSLALVFGMLLHLGLEKPCIDLRALVGC